MKKLIFLILLTLVYSCNSADNNALTQDKQQQLLEIYQYKIIPLHLDFAQKSKKLQEDIQQYQLHTTVENQKKAQEQWLNTIKTWKECQLYNIGKIKAGFLQYDIQYWPVSIEKIEKTIQEKQHITLLDIENTGSFAKGLSAIEYFLFAIPAKTINAKQLAYVSACAESIKKQADTIYTIWQTDKASFINQTQQGVTGALNQLINQMVGILDGIIKIKLEKALTKETIYVEKLEAFRSKTSLTLIKQEIQAIKACYNADFTPYSSSNSFKAHLEKQNQTELTQKIQLQLQECQRVLDKAPDPLQGATPTQVKEIQKALNALQLLIKVELSYVLDATITFNDTDGD